MSDARNKWKGLDPDCIEWALQFVWSLMSSKQIAIAHQIETIALYFANGHIKSMLMCIVTQDKQGNVNDGPGVDLLSNFHKKAGFQFGLIYIHDFLRTSPVSWHVSSWSKLRNQF